MSWLFGAIQLCELETKIGTKLLESHIEAGVTPAWAELKSLYQQESLRGKSNTGAQNNFSYKNPIYFSSLVPWQD